MTDPVLAQAVTNSVSNAVSDLAQLGTPVAWATGLFFLRDLYREFKDVRKIQIQHGERIARLEGPEGRSA